MHANIGTVTSKGQITIPKQMHETLGIREKDQLLFLVEDGRLVAIPLPATSLSELFGALPATKPFPGHEAIRQAVQSELGDTIARGDE